MISQDAITGISVGVAIISLVFLVRSCHLEQARIMGYAECLARGAQDPKLCETILKK